MLLTRTEVGVVTTWQLSFRNDPVGRVIADRHYNRQSVGADGFVPPGRCLVLLAEKALWVTSWPFPEFVRHDWPGAWINSTFRREGGDMLASDMIREAVAVTRWGNLTRWKCPEPELGMVTFVDPKKVRHKRDPGRCYRKAGFKHVGYTKGGLWAYQLLTSEMPPPMEPLPMEGALIAV